jgi:hypothetical protein
LPESTHKNDNGDCEGDWEAAYVIKKELDIRIPSIGLLSEDSTDITTLKNNINNLSTNAIKNLITTWYNAVTL